MRTTIIIAALLSLAPFSAAIAADAPAPAAPGRYTLTPSLGGFVRLDTQTGQVSECSGPANNLVCKSTPDERAAMQTEIDRLQKENDSLKSASAAQPTTDAGPQINVPSDQEVDKAFSFMERVVKRFKGLIEELRKEPAPSTPL